MANAFRRMMEQRAFRRDLVHWARRVEAMPAMTPAALARLRGHARQMRHQIDHAIHGADRLLLAREAIARAMALPPGTDWAWRPDPWAGPITPPGLAPAASPAAVAPATTLFHDGRLAELVLRQERNAASAAAAPFGLVIEVFGFDGSFASLTLDLPAGASAGLRLRHILRLDTLIECERPVDIFARLNIKHGPDVEQLLHRFRPEGTGTAQAIEFDLAPLRINERRIERLWIDLILERPAMNRIALRDVTASRLPRAEI